MRGRGTAFLSGLVLGAGTLWLVGFIEGPETLGYRLVNVVEGTTTAVNADGSAIGLTHDGEAGEGYVVAGATWRGLDGSWSDQFPTCLEPSSSGQRVRLGVFEAPPPGGAPGRPVVVWLECLIEPTERSG
jgi:hypothetical protein